MSRAVYLDLAQEDLHARALEGASRLRSCDLCPRACGIDRIEGRTGVCRTGRYAVVSSAFAHHGEEDCLRGRQGSGTVFFAQCALRCVFCQNFEISQPARRPGAEVGPADLARVFLALQTAGCHNLNLVTPEHVVPQVLEALALAVPRGLTLPIVYNTSGYEAATTLRLLDGVVDIYMPDFKLWSRASCKRYLRAPDYADRAREALLEMHRQVGPLQIGRDGLARRGLLVRHLVMPGLEEESRNILTWIRHSLGGETYVNLMDQYHPAGLVSGGAYPEIDRRGARDVFESLVAFASSLGLRLDSRTDGSPSRRLRFADPFV